MTPLEALQTYYGYSNFRPMQAEIVDSILAGNDTLALMPTGGGKSICFQVPALCKEGLCLVVTPLIALMKDQVQNLKERYIKATFIYAGLTFRETQTVLSNCEFGDYKFLYVSPERLEQDFFLQRVVDLPISMIAVDEAHCISQWGYDFRPSYLRIAEIRNHLRRKQVERGHDAPNIPILALTATATPEVVADIQDKLQFKQKCVFQTSFARKNLSYVVRNVDDKKGMLLRILRSVPGSSVVYVRNRLKTREYADFLLANGIAAAHYHAGLGNAEKDAKQKAWKAYNDTDSPDTLRVIVSTNAFGMGIDKPDVRTVIHMDLPDTIEAYFQEAGRAGRDGKTAYAVLLYNHTDKTKAEKRIRDNYPDIPFIHRVYEAVGNYLEVALGFGGGNTYAINLQQLCAQYALPILPTYSAVQLLSQAGYLAWTDETENNPRVLLTCTKEELYQTPLSQRQERIIDLLLRLCPGIFTNPQFINDEQIAERLGFDYQKANDEELAGSSLLNHELIEMAHMGILVYIPRRRTPYVSYLQDRVPLEYLELHHEDRQQRYIDRIHAMVEYAEQNQFCRSQVLLSYFGEDDAPACGVCDVCRAKNS